MFKPSQVKIVTRPLRNIQCLLGKQLQCIFGLVCQVIVQLKGEFVSQCLSGRILPVLSAIPFICILKKNSLGPGDDKHTHNMMQPPPCLTIWKVVLSDLLCWICPKHNSLYSGHKAFCSFTLVPYCKQDACFGIFVFCTGFLLFTLPFRLVLWSNYNVVDPSSVPISQQLISVTVLKSPLASCWNLWVVSFISGNWVRKDACIFVVIENFPGLRGWICVWNSLLEWGTLQIIACVGYRDEVVIQKSCQTLLLHTVIWVHITYYVTC